MRFLRLAYRDVLNRKILTGLLVINLVLALSGLILIESFERSLRAELEMQSKDLLGADIMISGRRSLTEDEMENVKSSLPKKSEIRLKQETYSMISSPARSRLANLRAIFPSYPFYGSGTIRAAGDKEISLEGSALPEGSVWIYPELAAQLEVGVGDSVQIGQASFNVDGIVGKDLSSSGLRTMLAPGVYLNTGDLDKTGLVRKGSVLRYRYLIKLPQTADIDPEIRKLENKIVDPGLRIRAPQDASDRTSRLARYVNDFLGLVVVIAILLSAIATAFLYRTYLSQKLKDIAILSSVGASNRFVMKILFSELLILVTLATVIATLVAMTLLPFFKGSVASLVDLDFGIEIHAWSIFVALLIAFLSVLLITFPTMLSLRTSRPSFLFQEAAQPQLRFSLSDLALYLPFFFFILSVAVWQSNSWKIGTLFVVSLTGVGLLLTLLGGFFLRLLDRLPEPKGFPLRFALRHVRRSPFSSVLGFLALCFAVTLASTVPQVEKTLQEDLTIAAEEKLPDFFLFDIQDEDVPRLEQALKESGAELRDASLMVRARLLRKNGEPFERSLKEENLTREEEREQRFRNRGYNLSTRPELFESETIVAGRPFSGPYGAEIGSETPVELSVEKDFAEDLGFELGDRLVFLVEGVEILGEVINFREVKWSSFQPNFFVLLQPGVLDAAPKTILATVHAGNAEVDQLQTKIVETAPNVSLIDVRRTIATILEFTDRVSVAIQFMAILTALAGFIVFISILFFQIFQRRWDFALVKVMTPSFSQIRKSHLWETALISGSACAVALVLSFGLAAALGYFVFDLRRIPPLQLAALISLTTFALSLLASFVLIRNQLQKSPARILGEKDLLSGA